MSFKLKVTNQILFIIVGIAGANTAFSALPTFTVLSGNTSYLEPAPTGTRTGNDPCFITAQSMLTDYVNSVNACITTKMKSYDSMITAATATYNAGGVYATSTFISTVNTFLTGSGCSMPNPPSDQGPCYAAYAKTSCKTANAPKLAAAVAKKKSCCDATSLSVSACTTKIASLTTQKTQAQEALNIQNNLVASLKTQLAAAQAKAATMTQNLQNITNLLNSEITSCQTLQSYLTGNSCTTTSSTTITR